MSHSAAKGIAVPKEVRWATVGLFALVALHIFVPIIMELQRGLFVDNFKVLNPTWSQGQVESFVSTLLVSGTVYHLIHVVLFAWLGVMSQKGKNWARIAVTVVLVFGILGTYFSFSSSTPEPGLYKSMNIFSWLVAFTILGLLWIPPSTRQYFAAAKQRKAK